MNFGSLRKIGEKIAARLKTEFAEMHEGWPELHNPDNLIFTRPETKTTSNPHNLTNWQITNGVMNESHAMFARREYLGAASLQLMLIGENIFDDVRRAQALALIDKCAVQLAAMRLFDEAISLRDAALELRARKYSERTHTSSNMRVLHAVNPDLYDKIIKNIAGARPEPQI